MFEHLLCGSKKKDGSAYIMSTLQSLRFGLCRYYKAKTGVDIIKDDDFAVANKVFRAQCVQMKKDRLAKIEHKPAITNGDMKKLYESGVFSTETPKTLLNKVFFEIVLCFCRRGRQNLRQLKKTDFAVKTNDRGIKYVTKISDELTKNHREDNNPEESGSMYETGGQFCPVASFEKYLQHSNPNNEFLFLRPKKEINNEIWYDNMVVGERMLANKMKEISTEAKLSHIYTNHSIRATSITLLDKAGFEARHIMTVSGLRNESSIRSYSKTDEKTKERMSRQLTAFARDVGRETGSSEDLLPNTELQRTATVSDSQEEILLRDLPSPLLSNSQEECLLRDIRYGHFQSTSTSQVSKIINTFHNCNVYFS